MRASYYWLALALGAAVAGGADPPAAMPGVLLLDDFRLVEGRVERFGNLYRVTADGKARLIRDVQVLHAGATRADVFKYVTDRADTGTAAGRVKLAGWFLKVGEPGRAAAEAKAAADLAPGDAAVRELLHKCEREALTARAGVKPPATVAPLPAPPPVVLPAAAASPAPVGPEAAAAFAARVQPVLMNVCAKCHAHSSYAGTFKLTRVPEGYANAAGTAANLAAAAGQLTRNDPAASPLLAKAVAAHGGDRQPPLPGRTHPAFRNLEQWVYAAGPPRPAAAGPAKLPPVKAEPVTPAVTPAPKAASPPATNPDDPFDPTAFNRRPPRG